MADVTMPQLGEAVTEGTIIQWFKQVGDEVAVDEPLFEVSTDKVDTEVPSPVAGVLAEVLAAEGDLVEVGQVLARVGDPGSLVAAAPAAPAPEPAPAPAPRPAPPVAPPPPPPAAPTDTTPADVEGSAESAMVLSPVVRRLIADSGIDAATLVGTGLGGRVTRADVEQAIRRQTSSAPAAAPPPAAPPPAPAPAAPPRPATVPRVQAGAGDSALPLNNIRRRTAEHMVMSKQTSPHVLTAVEVDFEGVERVRRRVRQGWKDAEGFSLTYLPFIARAVIDSLADYPHLNASFGDDELIIHSQVNLAIAVDLDFEGLLAPVVKGAEGKRLRQIAREVVDLAARARSRNLSLDDLTGGTFTITNPGQYGTMMQFPIINQPQVAILSTDGISRKPVVVTDANGGESIAVHSVGVLALAWDHRAFDGAYAAAFLRRIAEIIEHRDWETEIR